MSEFLVIVEFVGKIVSKVFNFTLDAIATIMLVASCVLPWRIPEVCHQYDEERPRDKEWKTFCLLEFLITLLDFFVVLFLPLALFSPMRWKHLYLGFSKYNLKNGDSRYRLRWTIFFAGFGAGADYICFLVGFFVLFSMGRQYLLLKFIAVSHRQYVRNNVYNDEAYADWMWDLDVFLFNQGLSTWLDYLCLFPFLVTCWIPIHWVSYCRGLSDLLSNIPADVDSTTRLDEVWKVFYDDLRLLWVFYFCHSVLDTALLPFYCLALLSPLRNPVLRGDIKTLLDERDRRAAERRPDVATFEYRYSWEVREKTVVHGFLAIADLLLLPMLLPLFLTQYRYRQMKDTLFKRVPTEDPRSVQTTDDTEVTTADPATTAGPQSSWVWGLEEITLIAAQFSLQFLDLLILAPCIPVLFATRIRWEPLKVVLDRPNVFLEESFLLYTIAIRQLSLLLLDCLAAPFALLVLATWYRSKPLRQVWSNLALWHRKPNAFHAAVFLNVLVLLFDAFIMAPAVLFVALFGCHRIPLLCYILWPGGSCPPRDSDPNANATTTATASPGPRATTASPSRPSDQIELSQVTYTALEVGADPPLPPRLIVDDDGQPVTSADQPTRSHHPSPAPPSPLVKVKYLPSFDARLMVLENVYVAVFDIVFFLMALMVIATLWRANELTQELRGLWQRNRSLHDREPSYRRPHRTFYVYFISEVDLAVRKEIGTQLCKLLRDFLCLLPLFFILATLYRIPELLTSIASKLAGKPLTGDNEALFTITRCTITQPEAGGPVIHLTLRRNPLYTKHSAFTIDAKAPVQMFVQGRRLFDSIEAAFGEFAVNVVRALLPVKLRDSSKTLGWPETFQTTGVKMSFGATTEEFTLWARLDLSSTTKRSSIVTKLLKLGLATVVDLQLECAIHAASGTSDDRTIVSRAVLVRLSPSVDQILSAIERTEPGELPASCLNFSPTREDSLIASDRPVAEDRSGNLVNSFHLLVFMVLGAILRDLYYLLIFTATLMSPYRWVTLVVRILEPASALPLRMMSDAVSITDRLDEHVQEYKKALASRLNSLIKAQLTQDLQQFRVVNDGVVSDQLSWSAQGWNSIYSHTLLGSFNYESDDEAYFRTYVERLHIAPYKETSKKLQKTLREVDSCALMSELVAQRLILHNRLLKSFFLRFACSAQLLGCYGTQDADLNTRRANNYNVAMSAVAQEHDAVVVDLVRNKQMMRGEVERQRTAAATGKKGVGLLKRSLKHTRVLITRAFAQAKSDIGFLLMFTFLLFTLIRAVPFLADLWRSNALNITSYQGKLIVKRHMHQLKEDAYHLLRLSMYVLLLCVTVAGLPAYLVSVPSHASSLRAAADNAKEYWKWILWYFCELVSLIFAFRTYRVVVKASLYVLLVPAACIAETLSGFVRSLDTKQKFMAGMVGWVGLLGGAIRTYVVAYNAGEGKTSASAADNALLILVACLFALLAVATVSLLRRPELLSPDRFASRRLEMTWDHLLSIACGPLESLQLSAVVMFYFWSGRASGDQTISLGSDDFSSRFLVWGNAYQGTSHGSDDSASLAVMAILVWTLFVSIPMALNNKSGSVERNMEKALQFRNSAAYLFIVNLMSRLFSVWIIATLMRVGSCTDDSITGASSTPVMATASQVTCGGDRARSLWASRLSVPLLVYFVITSTVLHSDDTAFLAQSPAHAAAAANRSLVKFSPLYVLLVKAAQLFVIAACMGGFQAASSLGPLLAILVVSVGIAAAPMAVSFEACSLTHVTPLRSAGFLCVAWTAIVCLARSSQHTDDSILRYEAFVFVGWGIVYAGALVALVWIELQQQRRWEQRLKDAGLDSTIDELLSVVETAFVDNALIQSTQSGKTITTTMSQAIRKRVQAARSTTELAALLLMLEELILTERLSLPFMSQRVEWTKDLLSAAVTEASQVPQQRHWKRNGGPPPRRFEAATQVNAHYQDTTNAVVERELEMTDLEAGDRELALAITLSEGGVVPFTAEQSQRSTHATLQALVSHDDHAVVEITPQFRFLQHHIAQLSHSIRPSSCLVQFSRKVFVILLSNHLPRDVCWEVYSYLVDAREIRRVLQLRDSELPYDGEHRFSFSYHEYSRSGDWPKVEDAGKTGYTFGMIRYAMSFVVNRRDLIFGANTTVRQTIEASEESVRLSA